MLSMVAMGILCGVGLIAGAYVFLWLTKHLPT